LYSFIFLHLTPLVPLSWKERGRNKKEGGETPLLKLLPPSPRGEGGQGDGVNATEKRNMIICVTNLSELAQVVTLDIGML
jgi:hypothetical protein